MFVLNIIDSKALKRKLRRLYVDHHAEYDFSESEEDFCELISLTHADTIVIQSQYEYVQGRYILNHILKFCPEKCIQKIIVLHDEQDRIPYALESTPHFDIAYHKIEELNEAFIDSLEPIKQVNTIDSKPQPEVKPYIQKKILYVTDDHFMQVIVKDLITKNTSYEFLTADNGAEGLEQYTLQHPHLVLTDLVMPKMDGMELCEEIKLNQHDDHTHVIIFFFYLR